MIRTRSSSRLLAMVVLLAGGSVACAQETPAAAVAPIPAQIITGKKVFIANGGVDATSLAAFRRAKEPREPYNQFYIAMKSWGRYELVSTPGEADLVLQLSFNAPISDCVKLTSYQPQLMMDGSLSRPLLRKRPCSRCLLSALQFCLYLLDAGGAGRFDLCANLGSHLLADSLNTRPDSISVTQFLVQLA